jgi:6-phosphogluconate dehydrogenase
MVHNAIEYADMELLAEAYHLLKSSLRATHDEMRTIFARWDQSELSSHLLSMVVDILGVREPDGSPLIDRVLDRAAQRGTGILAIESALDLGVPAGILAGAVFARSLSVLKDERIAASAILGSATSRPSGDRKTMIEDVRKALLSAKIIAYAEGFALLRRASLAWDWDLQLGQIARVWREGAVIGSPFLDDVADALDREPSASSLLLDARIKVLLDKTLIALRKTVARAVETGLALPVFTAAIVAYDGLRSPWLPANLIQAMRDRFGGTGFERIDRPRGEIYRHPWK